jgi:hypothetical protein
MPDDPEQRREVMEAFMAGGAGIERDPAHYFDYARIAPEILQASRPLEAGEDIPAGDLRAMGRTRGQLHALPIVSRRGAATLLVDTQTGKPLRTIRIAVGANAAEPDHR